MKISLPLAIRILRHLLAARALAHRCSTRVPRQYGMLESQLAEDYYALLNEVDLQTHVPSKQQVPVLHFILPH